MNHLKLLESTGDWALVNVRTLQVFTPWLQSSSAAIELAHTSHRGWDLEDGLVVTDSESFRRLLFQREAIPRMAEAAAQRRQAPRTASDLVQFHPLRAQLTRGNGAAHIW